LVSPSRITAFELLGKIELKHARSDDALHSKSAGSLSPRDRNLVTQLVYGTLRWQGFLDHTLSQVSSRPWETVCPEARILLRMGLYQVSRMDRIPDHALVNDAVEIAKLRLGRGTAGFVNGVLRTVLRTRPWEQEKFLRECPKWAQVSLPRWLWDRWEQRFGIERAREFAMSLNDPPAEALRVQPEKNFTALLAPGMCPSDLVPGAVVRTKSMGCEPAPHTAHFQIQDEASQLIPHLLGNCRGWRIWDACAAPGGKTSILSGNSGPSGLVISADRSWLRADRLAATLLSAGGAKPCVVVADARERPPFRVLFDGVLADVPCSGLGTLRRNPEIKWFFRQERLAQLQKQQLKILESTSGAVRPGGLLLYSTCSTEPEENECVVEAFLASHAGFRLRKPDHPPGIEAWCDASAFVRTFPSERKWDGFFAALMVRGS
jgi:16S rRNA (cytosine967-C5)-methyltransferase